MMGEQLPWSAYAYAQIPGRVLGSTASLPLYAPTIEQKGQVLPQAHGKMLLGLQSPRLKLDIAPKRQFQT